ncbi:MAG: tRNA (cmo5U34)-methyltransferase [Lysobacterales bacterium]|jgi:tRNA (cmo5U34)-methyltransferase
MSESDEKKEGSSLGHVPDGPWEFDESVTDVFTDMLRRSIPQYDVMRQSVFEIGCKFVRPGTHIVDLGCSRGDALAPMVKKFGSDCQYLGLEISEPMLKAARERFESEIESGIVSIEQHDLLEPYPDVQASVTLCVLTLQFTPIDHRQRILNDVYSRTAPGGVLILVEKILGKTAELTSLMTDIYHDHKTGQGYSKEEVERKRLALEGVLVPVTSRWNEELMIAAGFNQVDCFWRWMNFAGWIACK